MNKKHFTLTVLLLCLVCSAKSLDLSFLEGSWTGEDELPSKVRRELYYEQFYPIRGILGFIEYEEGSAFKEMLKYEGLDGGYEVKEAEAQGNVLVLKCLVKNSLYTEEDKDGKGITVRITILGDDWISIEGLEEDPILGKHKVYYRSNDGRKKALHRAVLNDGSVRMRTAPDLNGRTLYLLPKGYEAEVLDKSEGLTEIDGENWPWYKIKSLYTMEGWVYGKYLDIDKSFISDEKTVVIQNFSFSKNGIIYFFHDSRLEYVSDRTLGEEEIKRILKDADLSSPNLVPALNRTESQVHFTHMDYPFESFTKGEYLRKIYFGFKDSEANLKATAKGKVEFLSDSKKGWNAVRVYANVSRYDMGIRIGMTRKELTDLLGKPDEEDVQKLSYRAASDGDFTLEAVFGEDEKLTEYTLTFGTSTVFWK